MGSGQLGIHTYIHTNLEGELLEVEPVLQDITGEELDRRANTEKSVKQTEFLN